MFVQRLLKLYQRRKVAAQLGVRFERSATFRLPNDIVINGRSHRLSLPDENGVKVAFIDLLLDDCYGCKKAPQQVRTVLDIGGNVGLFGITARAAFPNATIHVYEPNPHLEKYLKVQGEAGRFQYFMDAVGLDDGKVFLNFHEDSVQTRSEVSTGGNIDQIAFRHAIEKLGGQVDFLKMDCEGAEWQLFEDKESWQKVQHLSMEYHLWDHHTETEVLSKVRGLGFNILSHTPLGGFGLIIAAR